MSAISLSSIVPQPLSTNPTPLSLKKDFYQEYFKDRQPEVQALNKALKSGDLAAAQQAYDNLVALGKTELHKDNPFLASDRALDFNAIGGALKNGDLTGAQQAFAALQNSFKQPPSPDLTTPTTPANLNPEGFDTGSSSGVNVIA